MEFISDMIDNIIGDDTKNTRQSRTSRTSRSSRPRQSRQPRQSRSRSKRTYTESEAKYESDSDSVYSDDLSQINETNETNDTNQTNYMNNPTFFMDKENNLIDNRKYERKTVNKVKSNNEFFSQFDPLELDTFGDPSSFNAVHNSTGTNSTLKRMETERKLANDGGYSNFEKNEDGTYGVINPKHFDMKLQPFFRNRGGNEIYNRSDMHQRKMESFTGSTNDPSWKKKKESSPLFSPIVGATNIYGNSVPSDEFEGRYIPSRERRYEMPFTQVRQAPGIGLGTNETASHGFHDNYRIEPLSTDTIRGPRGPKLSYTKPIIMGVKGNKGRVLGKQENRKPTTFTDFGTERITGVGGFGYIKAPTVRNVYDSDNMATNNRGKMDHQRYNPASGGGNHEVIPDKLRGNFRTPSKENYLQAEPRSLTLIEGMQARPSEMPYITDPTKRMQHNFNYLGPSGREGIGNGHTFNVITNIPDPTKRDQHNEYGRNGNVKVNGSQYTNSFESPDPTKRDQHNVVGRSGTGLTVREKQYNNSFESPDPTKRDQHNDVGRSGTGLTVREKQYNNSFESPDPTKRDQHNDIGRSGTGLTVREKQYNNSFESPDPTKRDQHNNVGRSGTGLSVREKQYNNSFESPDPTRRDQHNNVGRSGTGLTVREKQYTNSFESPDPTKRDQHKSGRTKGGASSINEKSYINTHTAPDPTKRDQHKSGRTKGGASSINEKPYINTHTAPELTKRDQHKSGRTKGGATSVNNKPYTFNYIDNIPEPTMRDIHGENNYINPAKNEIEGQRSRRDANTMSQNISKEKTLLRRKPTTSNYDKGPTFEFTKVELKDPLQMYEGRQPIKGTSYNTERFVPNSSFNRNESYYEDNRKQYVKDSLDGNPYINNMVHRAIRK